MRRARPGRPGASRQMLNVSEIVREHTRTRFDSTAPDKNPATCRRICKNLLRQQHLFLTRRPGQRQAPAVLICAGPVRAARAFSRAAKSCETCCMKLELNRERACSACVETGRTGQEVIASG